MKDYRKDPMEAFTSYYSAMMGIGDVDPAYPAMNYLANYIELNVEQRYWLAFLYANCYSAPTSWYIINEFPDYENVNLDRLKTWWTANKKDLIFQSDKRWIRQLDLFPKVFESYQKLVGDNQQATFEKYKGISLTGTYDSVWYFASDISNFGRFTLFNYLEALNELTPLQMLPNKIPLEDSQSSCDGLCYALNKPEMVGLYHNKLKSKPDYPWLYKELEDMKSTMELFTENMPITYWNLETCLCAYKKLYTKRRYLGYYIDRQMEEIMKMEKAFTHGVDWGILWQFRSDFFNHEWLGEFNNWKGIRKDHYPLFMDKGFIYDSEPKRIYRRKVIFENIGDVYQ